MAFGALLILDWRAIEFLLIVFLLAVWWSFGAGVVRRRKKRRIEAATDWKTSLDDDEVLTVVHNDCGDEAVFTEEAEGGFVCINCNRGAFICPECLKLFSSLKTFKRHLQLCDNSDSSDDNNEEEDDKEEEEGRDFMTVDMDYEGESAEIPSSPQNVRIEAEELESGDPFDELFDCLDRFERCTLDDAECAGDEPEYVLPPGKYWTLEPEINENELDEQDLSRWGVPLVKAASVLSPNATVAALSENLRSDKLPCILQTGTLSNDPLGGFPSLV